MKIISTVRTVAGERVREQFYLEERICKACRISFQPKTRKSFYCSRKCGKKAEGERNKTKRTEKSKKFRSKNKEAINERKRGYYRDNPEKFKKISREYAKNHPEQRKLSNRKYKDKTRHGGEREKLISESGLVCSMCCKEGDRFDITAHHESFNKTDHEGQILLCRSCHAKEHKLGESNETIETVCIQCGSDFTAKSKRFKYCSNKCKRRAEYLRDSEKIKARSKKWMLDNPEKYKEMKRQNYLNNTEAYKERSRKNRLKSKTGE